MPRPMAVLALLLLAGCASPADDDVPTADGADSDALADATDAAQAPAPKPLPPLELLNTTLDFAAPTGGSSQSADVTVPAGYHNLTVTFRVLNDCPSGYAAESPRLVLAAADGREDVLWEYGAVAPNEPYTCPVNGNFADRLREVGTREMATGVGQWTVRALGQFTGEAEVAVVAEP